MFSTITSPGFPSAARVKAAPPRRSPAASVRPQAGRFPASPKITALRPSTWISAPSFFNSSAQQNRFSKTSSTIVVLPSAFVQSARRRDCRSVENPGQGEAVTVPGYCRFSGARRTMTGSPFCRSVVISQPMRSRTFSSSLIQEDSTTKPGSHNY